MRWIECGIFSGQRYSKIIFLILLLQSGKVPGYAQDFSVYTVQHMSFGAFFLGATGGSIEIDADGSRAVTGDVVPLYLGIPFYEAAFEIEAPTGTIVSVLRNTEVKLYGSNGGMLTWTIGNTSPLSPFITTVPSPEKTQVHIGGKLTVSGAATTPAGTYTGNIMITFNRE